MSRLSIVIAFFLVVLVPQTSWAQESADAVKLFKEGREAIQRGDYNLACSKFEQSQAIDKRVGTLLNLALCEEKRTRLVQALATWRSAAELAKRLGDEREKEATDRAADLEPRVPKLILVLPTDAPTGTTVRIEGLTQVSRVLESSELGQPIKVDVGKMNITVIGPDGTETPQDVTLAEGESKTLTLEMRSPAKDTPPGEQPAAPVAGGGDTLMLAGLIVGGLGLVGVGVSLGFGAIASSKNDDSNGTGAGLCVNDVCGEAGLTLRQDALSAATVSTAVMVVGGIALAAGVTLVVVSFSGDDPAASDTAASDAATLRLGATPTGLNAQLTW